MIGTFDLFSDFFTHRRAKYRHAILNCKYIFSHSVDKTVVIFLQSPRFKQRGVLKCKNFQFNENNFEKIYPVLKDVLS